MRMIYKDINGVILDKVEEDGMVVCGVTIDDAKGTATIIVAPVGSLGEPDQDLIQIALTEYRDVADARLVEELELLRDELKKRST